RNLFILVVVLFILQVFTYEAKSCPRCNSEFYNELTTTRENTLIAKELLGSINNLKSSGSMYSSGNKSSVVTLPEGSILTQVPKVDNEFIDRKSTRLNSSHVKSSYAVFCLKKKI